MASFLENIEKLNFPKVPPPAIPAPVREVALRLGLTLRLTSPSVPEQYELLRSGAPSGYIRVRHGKVSITYPDEIDGDLYNGAVEGFDGFTDHERETKLLFALGLIAVRMMRA